MIVRPICSKAPWAFYGAEWRLAHSLDGMVWNDFEDVQKILLQVVPLIFEAVLSLKEARSGISPVYQNKSEIVKYVETAKASQTKGELKLTHKLC